MVCDPHLAQDVTQGVFVALARNARQLGNRPVLSGWLHRTAQNIAAQTVRTEVRRRAREQKAAAMNELLAAEPDLSWEHVAPHLDAALGELSESDRDALMLRYFERKSAREMAEIFGTSEDTAQRRVSRAVERLRGFFAKRGVTVGAGGLIAVISANAVQAAPVGLTATIATAAALTGTTLATTATATVTKALAMTTLQKTLVTATVAILAGAGIYETRQASNARAEAQRLRRQQAPLAEQLRQMSEAFTEATNQVASLRADNERLNRNTGELLRLRNAVGRLKSDVKDSTALLKDPLVQQELASKARVSRLEELLAQMPQQRIPELSLLDSRTYLDVARDADLETDTGVRAALSRLRFTAENQAAIKLQAALHEFSKASNGKPPEKVSDLASLIDPPMDPAIFDRYEILNTGTNVAGGWTGGWVLSQKQAVDPTLDRRWQISPVGFGSSEWEPQSQR